MKTRKNRFQIYRKANGHLQRELAQMLNMAQSTYNQKERGMQEFTLSEAYTLSVHLDITIENLFEMLTDWSW